MEVSKIYHFGNSIGLKQKTNLEYRRANLISERMNLIFVRADKQASIIFIIKYTRSQCV